MSETKELIRKVLKKEFSFLNKEQQKACFTANGPVLILAGAGSGKTTVLVNRIAYMIKYGDAYFSEAEKPVTPGVLRELEDFSTGKIPAISKESEFFIKEKPVSPYNILAITFTNKAAKEMKERLQKRLSIDVSNMWVSTFHSCCVRILRGEISKLGFQNNFIIYDSQDQKTLVNDCIKQLNLNEKMYPYRQVLSIISDAKDSMVTPEMFEKRNCADFRMSRIAKIYSLYQEKLKSANALDFDDIIMHTVTIFEQFPEVLSKWQERFTHILVDEYQDTNNSQYLLISLLAKKHQNLCVVGDDDQSIYKFRGANIENILNFEKEFASATSIKLEQNYRSTQNILDAANRVIENNMGRKGKNLWTDNGTGCLINTFTGETEQEEAYFIADSIQKIVSLGEAKFSDIALLYRMNAQTRVLEQALLKSAIPYRILSGTKFFDRKEIKDMVAYLRIVENPNDDVSFMRVINEPKRGIGKVTLDKLAALAFEKGKSLMGICLDEEIRSEFPKTFDKATAFADMVKKWKSELSDMPLKAFVEMLISESGYKDMLILENTTQAKSRIENLEELLSYVEEYIKDSGEEAGLSGLLEGISLMSDIDNYDESQDTVALMTLHSAKGLEFPVVFLSGMEEGIFPSLKDGGSAEEIEEERRLCYVGITRAKKELFLLNAQRRMLFGNSMYHSPSRFLGEIPKELVLDLSYKAQSISDVEIPKMQGINMGTISFAEKKASPLVRNEDIDFKAGDKVFHKKFGEGIVLNALPVGNDVKLEIAFNSVGTKNLMAAFAKLTKI